MLRRPLFLAGLLWCFGQLAGAPPGAHAQAPAAINVFLDCQAHGCETDHFRNEISFVNWVRDRTEADVHVLITSQETGGGGTSYALTFLGLREPAADTLQLALTTPQSATSTERRDALTNRIAQGLLRFAIHTSAVDGVMVTMRADDDEAGGAIATGADDPWNHWVFSAGVDFSADGEQSQASHDFELDFNADRVTEIWKFGLGIEGSYSEDRFELDDGRLRVVRRDYNSYMQLTRALQDQWSAGLQAEAGTSTFRNQDLFVRVAPVLEYSFFPYSDFARRRITLQYSVGANHYDYTEITLFDKLRERVVDEQLELALHFQQPWGSAGGELSGSHYFHDLSRYALRAEAGINVRLFKGLSADINGGYSRVHNQLYIQKGDASDEDVLTERLALATGYEYGMEIGLRYTFGSIFNNVVNRRLD